MKLFNFKVINKIMIALCIAVQAIVPSFSVVNESPQQSLGTFEIGSTSEFRLLSFEEYVQEIADLTGDSYSDVLNNVIQDEIVALENNPAYLNLSSAELNTIALNNARSVEYVNEIFPLPEVESIWESDYYAAGSIYYSYTGDFSDRTIQTVHYVGMDTGYCGTYKAFNGDFFVHV